MVKPCSTSLHSTPRTWQRLQRLPRAQVPEDGSIVLAARYKVAAVARQRKAEDSLCSNVSYARWRAGSSDGCPYQSGLAPSLMRCCLGQAQRLRLARASPCPHPHPHHRLRRRHRQDTHHHYRHRRRRLVPRLPPWQPA